MKKKIFLLVLSVTIIFLIAYVCILITKECLSKYEIDFKVALIIEILFFLVSIVFCLIKQMKEILSNIKREYYYIKEYDDKEIRLSFAYLIRIRINDKYLLIKRKDRDIFQPVGGVYHVEDWNYLHNKIKCFRDSSTGDTNDLRVKIKGKNIKKFTKWFEKKQDREVTPNREFREELVDSGILTLEVFEDIKFKFDRYFYKGVEHSQVYNKLELLRFDIYDAILTEEQLNILTKLNKKEIKTFSDNEIRTLGVTDKCDKRKMGTQTPYILEEV